METIYVAFGGIRMSENQIDIKLNSINKRIRDFEIELGVLHALSLHLLLKKTGEEIALKNEIYLFKKNNLFKIGKSKDAYSRLLQFGKKSTEIIWIGKFRIADELEPILHNWFREKWAESDLDIGRSEWFELSDADLSEFMKIVSTVKIIEEEAFRDTDPT